MHPENGEPYKVNPNTLLVFIDETGEESFNDTNMPFFGFGGLIVPCIDYYDLVEYPWHNLKREFFGEVEHTLHAADLPQPTPKNLIDSFNKFFTEYSFGRFAITCTDQTINKINERIENVIAACIWNRIKEVSNKMKWFDILILIEENKRLIPAIKQEFMAKTPQNNQKQKIPVNYNTILKDSFFAGLEVADFIAHTAGRQARIMRNQLFDETVENKQPDFEQIFNDKLHPTSYFNISRISYKNEDVG
ncbi:DUF3800 domain-containing protein [Reichenbachiella sp.]|uniref:DUF3800 domain-containing protein n=1 Tax=Reichenbachiella sp. TaxID=2184521 RepID=UPI003BB03057